MTDLRFFSLNLDTLDATPNAYALYALRHDFTRKVFFGSTTLLRDKLRWWAYAINAKTTKAAIPLKVKEVLMRCGHVHTDWSYAVVSDEKPERFSAHAVGADRPEWTYVMRLQQSAPEILLNSMLDRRGRPRKKPIRGDAVTSTRGTQPLTYLKIRMGILKVPHMYTEQPPHSWRMSTHILEGVGSPRVSFACYLCRSMMQANCINPSGGVIADLYKRWLNVMPTSERTVVEETIVTLPVGGIVAGVPYTIDAALAVPTPRGYETYQT